MSNKSPQILLERLDKIDCNKLPVCSINPNVWTIHRVIVTRQKLLREIMQREV